jgi:hypothetical protein
MAVRFEGFAKVVDRGALRPGRWITAAVGSTPALCFTTAIGEGAARTLLTFRPARVEEVQFQPMALAEVTGQLASVEDEVVFAAGAGAQPVQLLAPSRRPIVSGSLLRLTSGDLGVGFVGSGPGELRLVSLVTGEEASGFELVFDHWTLSLRRGATESLIGKFRGGLERRLSRFGA